MRRCLLALVLILASLGATASAASAATIDVQEDCIPVRYDNQVGSFTATVQDAPAYQYVYVAVGPQGMNFPYGGYWGYSTGYADGNGDATVTYGGGGDVGNATSVTVQAASYNGNWQTLASIQVPLCDRRGSTVSIAQDCLELSAGRTIRGFNAQVTGAQGGYYVYVIGEELAGDEPFDGDDLAQGSNYVDWQGNSSVWVYGQRPVPVGVTSVFLQTRDYYTGAIGEATEVPLCEHVPPTLTISVDCVEVDQNRNLLPFDTQVQNGSRNDYVYVVAKQDATPQWNYPWYSYGYTEPNGQTTRDVRCSTTAATRSRRTPRRCSS